MEGCNGASVCKHAIDISAIFFEFTFLLTWEQSGVYFSSCGVKIRSLSQCVLLMFQVGRVQNRGSISPLIARLLRVFQPIVLHLLLNTFVFPQFRSPPRPHGAHIIGPIQIHRMFRLHSLHNRRSKFLVVLTQADIGNILENAITEPERLGRLVIHQMLKRISSFLQLIQCAQTTLIFFVCL